MKNSHLALSVAIAVALLASGCGGGGGGGGVKDPPPPPTQPPPPPPPPTEPPPPPPPEARYRDSRDNLLVPTNADRAHDAGFTGQDVKIGLLDDAQLDVPHPSLDGRVAFYGDYTATPGVPDSATNAKRGHGTVIADAIVGGAMGDFTGGIAPNAQLYWGRICFDNSCWSDAAARAVDEMVDDGVSIFNLSLGSYYDNATDAEFSSAAWASGMKKAVDNGGLVVVSTGNDGKDTSGFPAGAPLYETQLLDNWLAVTSVNVNADGTVTTKADYANACGVAAGWCLAAPGLIRTPSVAGTDYVAGAIGTSMSASVVSGTAGLVLGAYPWMDGDNLQKTILTTATDLGAVGVDAVFGWGMVNAEKAVRGPGQFVADFNADVSAGTYVFENDINGVGGLIKDGAGTLVLSGNNTFLGDTSINEGVLGFRGNTTSDVFVNDGGTYASLGGELGGDYTASGTATTEISIGSPMHVNGTANLDGTLRLINPAAGYNVGGRESVLEAGTVAGTFSNTTYGSGFFWSATLDYTGTSVHADLVRTSGAASASFAGASQSVIDGAGQMDGLINVLDDAVTNGNTNGLEAVLDDASTVMNATGSEASASLASLTGQIHGTTRTLGVTSALNSARLHADRLPHLAGTEQRTAWISGTQIEGDLERNGYLGSSYRHNEVTFGVDVPVNGAVIGASISKAEVEANIDGSRDAMESASTGVTVYGVKSLGNAYVSGTVGYTEFDVDTRRDLLVGSDVVGVNAERDDSVWHARVETGYNFDNGLTPFVAGGAIRHTQEGFAERGDTTLGLASSSDTLNLHYLDVGLRHRLISGQWTLDSLVAYRNAFDGTDTGFDAWFNGLPEGSFTVSGQPIGKEAVRLMIGVGYAPTTRTTIFGNIGAEKVSGQQDNVSAQVGVRVAF